VVRFHEPLREACSLVRDDVWGADKQVGLGLRIREVEAREVVMRGIEGQ
jgi:hypothetical protein